MDISALFSCYPRTKVNNFLKYHFQHPEIYEEFRRLAHCVRQKTPEYSSRAILEMMRWNRLSKSGDEFKFTNSIQSFYPRLLVAEDPTFKNFFKFRK